MSARISGPPTNAPLHSGIREGPTTTSSRCGDKGFEPGGPDVDHAGRGRRDQRPRRGPGIHARGRGRSAPCSSSATASGSPAATQSPGRASIASGFLFALERTLYLIHRSRLVRVARGEVPADEPGREGSPDPGVRLQRQRPDRCRRRRLALQPPVRAAPFFSSFAGAPASGA